MSPKKGYQGFHIVSQGRCAFAPLELVATVAIPTPIIWPLTDFLSICRYHTSPLLFAYLTALMPPSTHLEASLFYSSLIKGIASEGKRLESSALSYTCKELLRLPMAELSLADIPISYWPFGKIPTVSPKVQMISPLTTPENPKSRPHFVFSLWRVPS
jgi:hypothetical protein